MARPRTITNEELLDVARDHFLEGGYGVSTAVIARAAGVSEGTLFNRFGTKDALFKAALGLPELEVALGLDELRGRGDMRENLEEVGNRLVGFYRELLPRMQSLCSRPGFSPDQFIQSFPDPPPLRAVRHLTHWFDEEMRLGRLRVADPEVIARMMMGALHGFAFFEMVGLQQRLPMASRTFVRGLVDVILNGIACPPDE